MGHQRKQIKVLAVDDHVLFTEGLKALLADLDPPPDFSSFQSCEQAYAMPSIEFVDLILLDVCLQGVQQGPEDIDQCLAAMAQFREINPRAPIVIISVLTELPTIKRVVAAGAAGFIPKTSSPKILKAALNLVLAGGSYLPPSALDEIGFLPTAGVNRDSAVANSKGQAVFQKLSRRQKEVLKHMVQGNANKVIAGSLNISEHTVKAHLSRIYRVLKVRGRTQAVYVVARLKLDFSDDSDDDDSDDE